MKQILRTLENDPGVYPRVYENQGIYIDKESNDGIYYIIHDELYRMSEVIKDPNLTKEVDEYTEILIKYGNRTWSSYNGIFATDAYSVSTFPLTTSWETNSVYPVNDTDNFIEPLKNPTYKFVESDWVNCPIYSDWDNPNRLLDLEELSVMLYLYFSEIVSGEGSDWPGTEFPVGSVSLSRGSEYGCLGIRSMISSDSGVKFRYDYWNNIAEDLSEYSKPIFMVIRKMA